MHTCMLWYFSHFIKFTDYIHIIYRYVQITDYIHFQQNRCSVVCSALYSMKFVDVCNIKSCGVTSCCKTSSVINDSDLLQILVIAI
jgi:hypothetical protein